MIPSGAVRVGEGFAINFLRRQATPAWVRRSLATGVVAALVLNAFLFLWLLGGSMVFFLKSSRLQGKFQSRLSAPGTLQTLKGQAQALEEQGGHDLAQINTALNLQREHFPVAARLAALAKTLPSRIWIGQISGDRADRSIGIQAVYVVDPSSPERLPAKQWIEAVQAHPSFRSGLRGVDLKGSKRKSQGGSDLFLFDIAAEWGGR